jgi:hypothetical protein
MISCFRIPYLSLTFSYLPTRPTSMLRLRDSNLIAALVGSLLHFSSLGLSDYHPANINEASICSPVQITVVQDGFSASATAIATPQSVTDFYAYDKGPSRSFGGGSSLPLAATRSVIAIHQDTLTCEISLVIVHSKLGEGKHLSNAEMYISGDLYKPLVRDDPSFTKFVLHDDSYDSLYDRVTGMTLVEWRWPRAETDGLANPLPSPDWKGCIQVEARFANIKTLGITTYATMDEWKFASSGGETIDLTLDRSLFICIGGGTPSQPGEKDVNCNDYTYPVCGYCDADRNACYWHLWCNIFRVLNCNFGANIPQP